MHVCPHHHHRITQGLRQEQEDREGQGAEGRGEKRRYASSVVSSSNWDSMIAQRHGTRDSRTIVPEPGAYPKIV